MTDTRDICDPPEGTAILRALIAAQKAIGVVAKKERNTAPGGNYNFRGIDTVVNASSPAFHEHGIVVTPEVLDYRYTQMEVGKNRSWMQNVVVRVRYTFRSTVDGSAVSVVTLGEASDTGDKATTKAMSVALRTALLQTLMLPTDEPDPDSYTYGYDDQRTGYRDDAPQVEQPSEELIRNLMRCAPNGETRPANWVQEQARSRGLDLYSRPDMERLLIELSDATAAQAVQEQLGGQQVEEEAR